MMRWYRLSRAGRKRIKHQQRSMKVMMKLLLAIALAAAQTKATTMGIHTHTHHARVDHAKSKRARTMMAMSLCTQQDEFNGNAGIVLAEPDGWYSAAVPETQTQHAVEADLMVVGWGAGCTERYTDTHVAWHPT